MAAAVLSRSLASSHRAVALSRRLLRLPSRFNFIPSRFPQPSAIAAASASGFSSAASSESRRHFRDKSPTKDAKPSSRNTKVNFSLSDSDSEGGGEVKAEGTETQDAKFPPPYDPFKKKPVIEEPEDPKNLQEIFHKMRTEGLSDYAVKMFDALSKDGRTHEALELFSVIKDRGLMPDVVAHTAVIEVYANAGGQSKEALRVFMRMLASGTEPNEYTYAVLVKGLAGDGKLADVKKYVMEMIGKEIMPNPGTCVAVFEAFVREGKEEEGRELFEEMKHGGFVPDEKGMRELLTRRRGPVVRSVMNILFGK